MTNSSFPRDAECASAAPDAWVARVAPPPVWQVAVIDNNPIEAAWIQATLVGLPGVRLHAFDDARVFLARLASGLRPDLALVDYRMPGVDGLEVGAALCGLGRRGVASWLLMTGRVDDDADVRARRIGAADVLYKPLHAAQLRTRVRRALEASGACAGGAAAGVSPHGEAGADGTDDGVLLQMLVRLARLRDGVTGSHLERMARYSAQIARRLGLPCAYVADLHRAAPMHDIGKIGVPDHILNKQGVLDPHEREVMRRHPAFGAAVLCGGRSRALTMARDIALSHHERFDGLGYPQGLSGESIPLEARIVAVADVFDALTTQRPYKPAWTVEAAVGHIRRGSGSHFDPAVVEAFLQALPEIRQAQAELADGGPADGLEAV